MKKTLLPRTVWLGILLVIPGLVLTEISVAQVSDNPVVIELGDRSVNLEEFNATFDVAVRMLAAQQGIALGEQAPETIERLRKQYLGQRASELALVQEARERGIEVSESNVLSQAASIREKIDSDESVDTPLDQVRLLDLVRDKQLVAGLTAELLEEIDIRPGDVVVLHHDLQEEIRRPEQICLRHILVEDEATAVSLRQELENGADFEKLAMELSTDDKTAEHGGDMGCFAREGYRARSAFEQAAFEAEVEELTGPVESEFGYHLMMVYRRIPSYVPTLNEAYDELEAELRHEKLPQKLVDIRENSGVKTYPENL